jgi:hypothetical protein
MLCEASQRVLPAFPGQSASGTRSVWFGFILVSLIFDKLLTGGTTRRCESIASQNRGIVCATLPAFYATQGTMQGLAKTPANSANIANSNLLFPALHHNNSSLYNLTKRANKDPKSIGKTQVCSKCRLQTSATFLLPKLALLTSSTLTQFL